MKTCSKCKRLLGHAHFCKHRSHSDGLSSICKECKNAARRKGPKPTIPDDKMRARYRKMRINGKQVSVHRYVAEQMLGRPLNKDEVVHHINGDKLDNRPENLAVLKASEHSFLENKGRKHSEETRRKVGLASMGRTHNRGKVHTPEHNEKIAASVRETRKNKFWSTRPKSD